MLLNYCQLWRWTDGYNTAAMITGGVYIIPASDEDILILWRYCNSQYLLLSNAQIIASDYLYDMSLLSLSGLLWPAWTVSAAESKLKEEKYLQCYSEIDAFSYFGVPLNIPLAGEVGRGAGNAPSPPTAPPSIPLTSPA